MSLEDGIPCVPSDAVYIPHLPRPSYKNQSNGFPISSTQGFTENPLFLLNKLDES